MATTTVRWQTAKAIAEALANTSDLALVDVHPCWPGDKFVAGEMIWMGELDGDVSYAVMAGPRQHRDDIFTVPIRLRVTAAASVDEAMTRLSELMAAVEDVLASNLTLTEVDGVLSAVVVFEGMSPARTPEGDFAFGEITVQIHSRLI